MNILLHLVLCLTTLHLQKPPLLMVILREDVVLASLCLLPLPRLQSMMCSPNVIGHQKACRLRLFRAIFFFKLLQIFLLNCLCVFLFCLWSRMLCHQSGNLLMSSLF